MLQNMYYDVNNPSTELCGQSIADANSNTTPFSVKDILNIVDGNGEGYMSAHLDG